MRKTEGDYTSGGAGRFLGVFGVDVCNAKKQTAFLQRLSHPPLIRKPFYCSFTILFIHRISRWMETVDADFPTVGVEGEDEKTAIESETTANLQ